jgi:predicted SprT family Zn-dependent metalloprotease
MSDIDLDRTIQADTDEDDAALELLDPTNETYRSFHEAYDFFNLTLFDERLPGCLFTMQRSKRSRGFFAFSRFGQRRGSDVVDEIALNPRTFIGRSDREIISTAVHEMVHQWQFHFGKPGRRGYHNKEWAAKMREVGLIPSHTGEPGGKQTGQSVSHYIEDSGSYDTQWQLLEHDGFRLEYQDRHALRPDEPRKVKVRYACPQCSIHVWGKPGLHIVCGECQERMP